MKQLYKLEKFNRVCKINFCSQEKINFFIRKIKGYIAHVKAFLILIIYIVLSMIKKSKLSLSIVRNNSQFCKQKRC